MDYQKLDPTLAAELDAGLRAALGESTSGARELSVFVHVADPVRDADADRMAQRLRSMGVIEPVQPGAVLTMSVSPQQVAELSEESWVVAIRAARQLRTLS
ncbi:MAG: hypothetical protein GEU94_18760 [Micromonosporaceae bacterium]|nr:hypothetical protein [Micromonosporaceae bacterium]